MEVADNRHRRHVLGLDRVDASKLRLVMDEPAGVCEIRVYDEPDVELMRFVRRLRALELPLDDIREIVQLRTSGEAPCQPVRDAIARESEAVDDRIAELNRLRTELRSLQQRMDATVDQWPQACVCHVIEETP